MQALLECLLCNNEHRDKCRYGLLNKSSSLSNLKGDAKSPRICYLRKMQSSDDNFAAAQSAGGNMREASG